MDDWTLSRVREARNGYFQEYLRTEPIEIGDVDLLAAFLAQILGVHSKVVIQSQKASAGDWASYAADVSRRATESQ